MFNPNLILNVASELNLSINLGGDLNKILKKIDTFKPKNNDDILVLNEKESDLFKTTQLDLNELKKVRMTIKILRLGIKITKFEDLSHLKELKIENLFNIDPVITSKVHDILLLITSKQETLYNLNKKDNATIINDYNLMPKTTLMIIIMFLSIILSLIFLYLGLSYIFLSNKYSFFNDTIAFWTTFLSGLIFLFSLNSFFQNIFLKMQELKNRQKIYEKLAKQYLAKRENRINKTLLKLKKKQFEIERKSIKEASILKLKEILTEETKLLKILRNNFI